MVTEVKEKEFYREVYLLSFGKEAEYFYQNDAETIAARLKACFWGEDLERRSRLLVKLLHFDSFVNPHIREELQAKSKSLRSIIQQTTK